MKIVAFFALFLAGALSCWGQVSVQLELERRQYLAQERVTGVVTIVNRSGREITYLSQDGRGMSRSWLDFSMRDTAGRQKPKLINLGFRKAILPAGRSISREVDLGRIFSITSVGNYAVTAHVTELGADDVTYTSNSAHFTVGGGNTIYRQPFGVPQSPAPKREYSVITFNDGKRNSIYAQVMNTVTGRTISTFRLSNCLTFHPPQMILDSKNQLHILYLAAAEVFVHVSVNQDGMLTETKYFKRAQGRAPRFVNYEDQVSVLGATPYDPTDSSAGKPRRRSASERPQ
jgi:hypothetical protein